MKRSVWSLDVGVNNDVPELFSSPEPKAHKVSLYDGHDPALVRRRRPSSTISKTLSEAAWAIKLKWVVAFKFCSLYLGHMTKMAATPIYGKNLHQKHWADFHETWYVASGTPTHHSLIK